MSRNLIIWGGLLVLGIVIFNQITLAQDQETLYQVSTYQNLSNGGYDSDIAISQLKTRGDFGLGTFSGLDGEMIILNGTFYQAIANGTIIEAPDYYKTPFTMLTYFEADNGSQVNQTNGSDVQNSLNQSFPNRNIFYAIKIEGNFSYIKARSVPLQKTPYQNLSEALKNQTVFDLRDVNGTIVGFWCPDYMGGIDNPGFHFHFINGNKTIGGHVLEFQVKNGTIQVDYTPEFYLIIPKSTV